MNTEKFYVTTPIYYVNARPHIGHAYTTILADALARYHRLAGVPTFFLTGTDEHGQKVARAAEKDGVSPQQKADSTVVRFTDLWRRLEITNDDFIRTTEPRHKDVVRRILADLYDRGEIYRAEYDGWYCVACERFFTEKDLADGKCPEAGCGRQVERITEANYFFRMSKYREWLIGYINDHPAFIQPDFRRNETLGFLRGELNDLCISRPKSRLSWGIELPFDSDFVTYVWFDALVNYVSAVGYLSDEERFSRIWPATCQLIGKDILTTHTVYWPTMLKAIGLPLPETIFAHGWWLLGESKMSKTAGNVVDPMSFAEKYGVDAFRYFLLAEMVLGRDASFSEEAFVRRYNSDLANDLGNLLSRFLKIVETGAGGVVPDEGEEGEDEVSLRRTVLDAAKAMSEAIAGMRVDLGIAAVIGAVRETNRYFEKKKPWALAKQADRRPLNAALRATAETLRIVSGLLQPVMPGKMAELRSALGMDGAAPEPGHPFEWGKLPAGARVRPGVSLFPRIGTAAAGEAKPRPEGERVASEGKTVIEYAEFEKIELKTARVLSAEKVAGADRLLKLEIEIGAEKRQIVAGVAQYYAPEEIVGRTVVVVANLKPATIRGVESRGMLLAATGEDKRLRLVTVDGDAPSGAAVR